MKILLVVGTMSLVAVVLSGCFGPTRGPLAVLSSAIISGTAPLEVGFNLSLTSHPDGRDMTFELNFGDGSSPVSGTAFNIILEHTYETAGTYTATLLVTDDKGRSGMDSLTITAEETGPEEGLLIGNLAPDFTASTTDGGEITLSDYRGNVVLLDFWGAWCGPCRNSMPYLDNLVTKYSEQGLVAIIVSTDVNKQDAVDFLASAGLTQFISVWEAGGKQNPIDLLYGDVPFYPTTYVLDRQGVIRWISVGYPGTLTEPFLESLL